MKSIYEKFINFLKELQKARLASAYASVGDYVAAKKLYDWYQKTIVLFQIEIYNSCMRNRSSIH